MTKICDENSVDRQINSLCKQCCHCQISLKRNHKTIKCLLCKIKSCISCAGLSNNLNTKYICQSFYYCKNCRGEIFPFQGIDNTEFENLMQTPTYTAKLLNTANENEVDWPNETFSPNCKYRSVEWFSKTLFKESFFYP